MKTVYTIGIFSLGAWRPTFRPPLVWDTAEPVLDALPEVQAVMRKATDYPYRYGVLESRERRIWDLFIELQ